jgi:thioredoxin reductase (NADPH)
MTTEPAPDATLPKLSALTAPTADELFPRLSGPQLDRLAPLGELRQMGPRDVLIEPGDQITTFFVVIDGEVEILRPTSDGEDLVVVHGPGQFVGELNSLSGRRSLVRARTRGASRLITLTREALLDLVQTDAELGEILMRAFILRRLALVRSGRGDVVVVGSSHSAGTLRVKEFLSRNGYPYSYLDLERDADAQELLDRLRIAVDEIPIVLCPGERVLRHPTNAQVAECLGFNEAVDETKVRDVVVIGAGPAGLAAAVYAASEGLDVLVLETVAPGGQAGSSSKIENYLGFPLGIAGQELAARAYNQAQKFGAEMLVARGATRLACGRTPYAVETDGGRLLTRSVVIATGAQYRKPPLPDLARFEGAGVYYGATFLEQQVCGDEDVIVVGGGNSAGQAAVFLSQSRRHVYMLVRGAGLVDSMSKYLIRRIEECDDITLLPYTEITALHGTERLERVTWTERRTGASETRDIRHVFLMTGAVPNTAWLDGCVALDRNGFIRTGVDLAAGDLTGWPLARAPFPLETNLPGVFAVGDVRAGNTKRVASAVGEGSAAVSLVHKALAG